MIYNETVDPNIELAVEEVDTAKSQAQAQYECLSEMVERLAHCNECSEDFDSGDCEFADRFDSEEEFDEYHDEDEARSAINDDPLEVSVRSGWSSPGGNGIDGLQAEDFLILLCTGGPAVRIRGELSNGIPDRAWIEYQDWGTGWTQYFDTEQDTLLAYASNFYFGE